MDSIIVLITAATEEEAVKIARVLVETKLAACVNIISEVRSIYRWEGTVEDGREFLMIVKTVKNLFSSLEKKVKELHTYAVPEIISIDMTQGSSEYLAWLAEATS